MAVLCEAILPWKVSSISDARNARSCGRDHLGPLAKEERFLRRRWMASATIPAKVSGRISRSGVPFISPPLLSYQIHRQRQLLLKSLFSEKANGSRRRRSSICLAKNARDDDDSFDEDVSYDENGFDEDGFDPNGFDKNGFDRNGRDKFGRDKYGLDEGGFDNLGLPGDAVLIDGPINQPEYHTYVDPSTGEPAPTYGYRNALPNAAFWGDDLETIQRSTPSFANRSKRSTPSIEDREEEQEEESGGRRRENESTASTSGETDLQSASRGRAGRKRGSKKASSLEAEVPDGELSEEELANALEMQTLRDKFRAGKEEEAARARKEAAKAKLVKEREKADGEEGKEDNELSLGDIFGPNGHGSKGYPLASRNGAAAKDAELVEKPLTNDELWWNWRKPPPEERPWSAWQQRPGDSDTVMAAAMAETGQIKLFGEKPTVAESVLARARKRVFYNERMAAEEERKKEIGALAYYKEWVKAYKEDASREAVQNRQEETGDDEGGQLLEMFAFQSLGEYRVMQGTDIRIQRDPLIMRMRPEQIKQVWGGDPVYPTVNYEQEPDSIADFRNENMHEPRPDILETLRESGRLMTQEELRELLLREKLEEEEHEVLDGLSGAIDIGEEDEDEVDEDEDVEYEEQTEGKGSRSKASKRQVVEAVQLEEDEAVIEVDNDDGKSAPFIIDNDDET